MKKMLLTLLCVFLVSGIYAQLSFEDTQILYVSFDDETDLSATDSDFELTEEVNVFAEEGIFGGAAYFDPEGSWIVYEPLEGFNHAMDWTWSVWLKTESIEDFWGVMGWGTYSGDPMTDWYDAEPLRGGIAFSSWGGVFEVELSWLGWIGPVDPEPEPWNDGEWHHVAFVHSTEAQTISIYVDDVLAGQGEVDIAGFDLPEASLDDDNIKLGFAGAGWGDEEGERFTEIMYYDGFMDDFRLFNKALSEEEIGELYDYMPAGNTGIGDLPDARAFNVYPNPAGEYIVIDSKGHSVELSIYNISGQLVMSSMNETRVDISSLSRGLYFVDANVDGVSAVQKLIVE